MDNTAPATLLAWLDREIWLVSAQAGSRRGGLIATHVTSASIVPELPRMLVGIAKHHSTWSLIEESNAFALHLLREENLEWVWRFGLQSGRDHDKLFGLRTEMRSTGSPVLRDTIGWLDCRIENRMDTGERTVYLAEVVEGGINEYAPPLTVKRLMELAPQEKLAEMKHQLHLDAILDNAAIDAWRQRNK